MPDNVQQQVDPGMQMQMQPTFSDLAFAKFLQSFPDLAGYVVTFKDLTEELPEESDIQVGALVLTNQVDYFYVPIISKSGTIGAIDSIYQYSTKRFSPLTPKTVEAILTNQNADLGSRVSMPTTVRPNPSVYDLVTPPRTGKITYASSSRLTEFLAVLPDTMKEHLVGMLRDKTDLAESLHGFFGLKDILQPLMMRNQVEVSIEKPTIAVITEATGLPEADVAEIISKGYIVRGIQKQNRIAVSKQTIHDSKFHEVDATESGNAWSFVTESGDTVQGMILSPIAIEGEKAARTNYNLVLTELGTYLKVRNGNKLAVSGEPLDKKEFLKKFCVISPLKSIRNVDMRETFTLLTPRFELVGTYRVTGPLELTNLGYRLRAYDVLKGEDCILVGSKNYAGSPIKVGREIIIPASYPVAQTEAETDINIAFSALDAFKAREAFIRSGLGKSLRIGFDGSEFSAGGRGVGNEAALVKLLVMNEGLAPESVSQFVKEAKEVGVCEIMMSKEAEIPSYGAQIPEDQQAGWLPNALGPHAGGYTPSTDNLQAAAMLKDTQIMEATMLVELLQTPDMFGEIREYLPDIDAAIDKLGRILFLMRINLTKLSDSISADSIMTTLASIKNVYRILGENAMKLRQLVVLNTVA